MRLIRSRLFALNFCLLVLALLIACSSCTREKTDEELLRDMQAEQDKSRRPQELLTVSFQTSVVFTSEKPPPFSGQFDIVRAKWLAGATSDDSGYKYTAQQYCLEGRGVTLAEDGKTETFTKTSRNSLSLCFSVNDPIPYTLVARLLHTGTFPIGQLISGKMYSDDLNKVTGIGVKIKEYYDGSNYPRDRNVDLNNLEAQGLVEITLSEKDRIAGKFDIKDNNLSISGSFNCIVVPMR